MDFLKMFQDWVQTQLVAGKTETIWFLMIFLLSNPANKLSHVIHTETARN